MHSLLGREPGTAERLGTLCIQMADGGLGEVHGVDLEIQAFLRKSHVLQKLSYLSKMSELKKETQAVTFHPTSQFHQPGSVQQVSCSLSRGRSKLRTEGGGHW